MVFGFQKKPKNRAKVILVQIAGKADINKIYQKTTGFRKDRFNISGWR